jgi:hypothetical protein
LNKEVLIFLLKLHPKCKNDFEGTENLSEVALDRKKGMNGLDPQYSLQGYLLPQ